MKEIKLKNSQNKEGFIHGKMEAADPSIAGGEQNL
jgi:hypothetical protein